MPPETLPGFLNSTVGDWLRFVAAPLVREGYKRKHARAFAALILAGLRGFMLDYCATGDRKRLDRAVELWLRALDPILLNRR